MKPLVGLLIAGAIAGAFVAGRMSAERGAAALAGDPPSDAAPAAARAGTVVGERPRAVAPAAPPLAPPPAGDVAAADPVLAEKRADRAAFLLDRVFEKIRVTSSFAAFPSAEAQATSVSPYLTGLLEGAVQSDPNMRAAFGAELQSRLCGARAPSDAEVISLARVVTVLPDVATADSLDCFFAKAKEDVPLWSMMDAWRSSGLPKTAALARLEASAQDARTRRRFADPQEEARRRSPGP